MRTTISGAGIKSFLIFFLLNFLVYSSASAQCSAVPGELFGSGSFCIGEQIDIGIPLTKTDQTYTWYQNAFKIVKGPVNGNGSGISYEAAMAAGDTGHYTVVTAKEGCTSTEFGDVEIERVSAPAGLVTTSVYFDSVAFKWKAVADILGYEYAVDNDSLPPPSGTFTNATTASQHSLTPFANYYMHVRAVSFTGGDCEWSTTKFTTVAATGPGSLDKTFNKSGKIITANGQQAQANAEAIQADGKVVAAGASFNADWDFAVVRYTADGKPDKSFGDKGKIITDLGGQDQISGVGIQTDGKIVVAGSTNASINDIALVRYNTDGSLDNTFGSGGKVFTRIFNNNTDQVQALAVQADGKIVVTGYAVNSSADIILVRFNSNGSLDAGFGSGGKVITDLGISEVATSMAIQADSKIVVAGFSHNGTSAWDFLTLRYKKNGLLDSSFGTNGKVFTDFGDIDEASSVAIQTNGKIVVAGSNHDLNSFYSNVAIARYKSNGTPDNAFDFDGKVYYANESGTIYAHSVALSSNGKIIVAGTAYNGTDNDVALLRFISNGQIDPDFGYEGKILTDFGYNNDYANAMRLQQDGKIVIAGSTTNNMGKDKIIVARYNSDNTQIAPVTIQALSKTQNRNVTRRSAEILISPNPAKDVLHISGLSSFNTSVYISDITGRILKKYTSSGSNYSCTVTQLTTGIYYLIIDENKNLTYIKFIKE